MADGKIHQVRIIYSSCTFYIFLDGKGVLSCKFDISKIGLKDDKYAWIGFTASTGKFI